MGIPLLSVDGYIIKRVKSYILECFSCMKICRDNTKQFCPVCGNASLLRVTCSFNQDGSFVLYRRKGYKVNMRGKRFAIPLPKGGQRNNDLILSEDQLDIGAVKKKIQRRENFHRDQLLQADHDYECGFGFDNQKKANKHFPDYKAGYGRANPNSNEFWKKRGGKH